MITLRGMAEHRFSNLCYSIVTYKLQLSRGEICVANFIPPANGESQGNYFQAKIPKIAVFDAKKG